MVKVDIKDKKILYHLEINSRQSFNSIGKKVGLSKVNVAYRVKKLQEKGIIKILAAPLQPEKPLSPMTWGYSQE